MVLIYQDKRLQAIPQQTNFTGKLEKYDGAAMPCIVEKQQKTTLIFFIFINCNRIISQKI